jgi:hypothetical protein
MSEQPTPPGTGNDGRWVKIGRVSVDSSQMGICDPGYAKAFNYNQMNDGWRDVTEDLQVRDWCSGVSFMAGFGDGGYDVWGWVVDYGDGEGGPDKRIAQVVITLIDDDDVVQWNSH